MQLLQHVTVWLSADRHTQSVCVGAARAVRSDRGSDESEAKTAQKHTENHQQLSADERF